MKKKQSNKEWRSDTDKLSKASAFENPVSYELMMPIRLQYLFSLFPITFKSTQCFTSLFLEAGAKPIYNKENAVLLDIKSDKYLQLIIL